MESKIHTHGIWGYIYLYWLDLINLSTIATNQKDLRSRRWNLQMEETQLLKVVGISTETLNTQRLRYDCAMTKESSLRYWTFLWVTWWRYQMETFSALLALCAGNLPVTGEFPAQKPVTRSFDVFFNLHLNQQFRKKSRRRWFETPLCSLWRHCNESTGHRHYERMTEYICWAPQLH